MLQDILRNMNDADQTTQLIAGWLEPVARVSALPIHVVTILVLFSIGLFGHFLIQWVMSRLNHAADKTQTPWDNVLTRAAAKPIEWALWVLLAYLSLGVLDNIDALRSTLRHAADTGAIVLLGWFLHGVVVNIENELLSEQRGPIESDDRAAISAAARLGRIILWAVVTLMLLQSMGISISGLLAFGGIGGIAVGFAARDLLANFLGGLSVYLDRPFTVGDWIRSPDREIEGTVEHIGWRMTRIRTFDQRPLYIPNAVFSNVAIENPSRMRNRRIYETIGIRYSDVSCMDGIVSDVKAMLSADEAIDTERTLMVNFVTCGASSLDFFIYTFTKTTNWVDFHAIKQDVLLRILSIIEAHGAEVAFPTQTLHVGDDDRPFLAPEPEL